MHWLLGCRLLGCMLRLALRSSRRQPPTSALAPTPPWKPLLQAPPLRVAGFDTPFPLVYEPLYLPSVKRIVEGVRKTVRAG